MQQRKDDEINAWLAQPNIILTEYIEGAEVFDNNKREYSNCIGMPCASGEFIIPLANIFKNQSQYEEFESYLAPQNEDTVNEYVQNVYQRLLTVYSISIAQVVVVDLAKLLTEKSRKKKPTITSAHKRLLKDLQNLTSLADAYVMLAHAAIAENRTTPLAMMSNVTFGAEGIGYDVLPGYQDGDFVLYDMFIIRSGAAAIKFDLISAFKDKQPIKVCENCGRYFTPSARSDEIYCNNITQNGRTCKQIGYENKVESNEVLKTYRTIYKTQNARKQRNKHISDIDNRFKCWAQFAVSEKDRCLAGEISVEQMKRMISSDSWLRKE